MAVYIVLGVLILFVAGCFTAFTCGLNKGERRAKAEYAEELRRRAQTEKEFNRIEESVKQEVFNEAEQKKVELSSGDTGRDRFNNINSSLQSNSGG